MQDAVSSHQKSEREKQRRQPTARRIDSEQCRAEVRGPADASGKKKESPKSQPGCGDRVDRPDEPIRVLARQKRSGNETEGKDRQRHGQSSVARRIDRREEENQRAVHGEMQQNNDRLDDGNESGDSRAQSMKSSTCQVAQASACAVLILDRLERRTG